MRPKRFYLFSTIAVVLAAMLLVIVYGDNGLMDLFALRGERDRIVVNKEKIFNENIALYRQIDRLKSDPEFIEATARKELGLVGDNELIFKLKQSGK